MKKRSLSGRAISTTDWMVYRFYERFTPYDGHYLRMANHVFDLMNDRNLDIYKKISRDDLKTIAISLTGYFEDFINDIGIWAAVRRVYRNLYGMPLPFYQIGEEYDEDYINVEDIAYLIWHQCSALNPTKFLNPMWPPLLIMSQWCFDYFEEMIEKSPATDLFQGWLHVEPDIPYFTLKDKLIWTAFHNFLLTPAFKKRFSIDVEEMVKDSSDYSPEYLNKTLYAIQEDYLYLYRSTWGGMTAAEWFVEMAQLDDSLAADVKGLHNRITSEFLYTGFNKAYYLFEHLYTGRVFEVARDSIDLEVDKMEPDKEVGVFAIVNWRGEWWLSGSFIGWGVDSPSQLEKIRRENTGISYFLAQSPEDQENIIQITAEMEEAFKAYFGDNILILQNKKEAEQALDGFHAWWNKHKTNKKASWLKKSAPKPPAVDDPIELPFFTAGAVGVYFDPGAGIMVSPLLPKIIQSLKAPDLDEQESNQLFGTFFRELPPSLCRDLVRRYGYRNLRHPMELPESGWAETYFEFFLRFYNPQAHERVKPLLAFMK